MLLFSYFRFLQDIEWTSSFLIVDEVFRSISKWENYVTSTFLLSPFSERKIRTPTTIQCLQFTFFICYPYLFCAYRAKDQAYRFTFRSFYSETCPMPAKRVRHARLTFPIAKRNGYVLCFSQQCTTLQPTRLLPYVSFPIFLFIF